MPLAATMQSAPDLRRIRLFRAATMFVAGSRSREQEKVLCSVCSHAGWPQGQAVSAQKGAQELVDQATSPRNLCRMDPTWHPWL